MDGQIQLNGVLLMPLLLLPVLLLRLHLYHIFNQSNKFHSIYFVHLIALSTNSFSRSLVLLFSCSPPSLSISAACQPSSLLFFVSLLFYTMCATTLLRSNLYLHKHKHKHTKKKRKEREKTTNYVNINMMVDRLDLFIKYKT